MGRRRAAPELVEQVGELAVLRDARRPTGRLLRQGGMDASYVDLADPRHLEFDYLRRMRDVVELTGARRVVHVGGAGCALARALAAANPDHRQEVIERDPEVLELARRRLGLRRVAGLKVRVGDGRAVLAGRPGGSADAAMIDAFEGARVPRHLVTAEACADLARVAALAAVNVVDTSWGPGAGAIGAALASAFPHTLCIASAKRGGNVVLVGAHAPLPVERLRARAAADIAPAVVERLRDDTPPWRDAEAQAAQ